MPFTLSHAAIVIPIKRIKSNWFSLTGLAFGSISPDLEYFSRMRILATHGHDWLGAIYFDIPLALIYSFIFHLYVRNILIVNLPSVFKSRFIHLKSFNWWKYFKANGLVVLISILIGTYSHLLWDAFTHEWGFFAKRIPLLQEVWFNLGIELKGFKVLQYFSSIIGLVYIFICILKLPAKEIENSRFNYKFWFKILFTTILISMIRFFIFPIEIISGNLIVVPMMASFISLIIFRFIEKYTNKKPQV